MYAWVFVVAFITIVGPSVYAESAKLEGKVIPKEKVTHLTPCPDCTGAVSKRAVMCPHCGCPGDVIVAAVQKAKLAAEPKSIVRVVADKAKGSGVAVKDGDST